MGIESLKLQLEKAMQELQRVAEPLVRRVDGLESEINAAKAQMSGKDKIIFDKLKIENKLKNMKEKMQKGDVTITEDLAEINKLHEEYKKDGNKNK